MTSGQLLLPQFTATAALLTVFLQVQLCNHRNELQRPIYLLPRIGTADVSLSKTLYAG
jgi:hypothetical protein